MKKIELKGLDLTIQYEKLEDGLELYFIPMPYKTNYFITYATKFGSLITDFVPIGSKKMVKVPDGIAHFLEHKMFEQEDGIDPFTFFSKTGTGSNASTSYDFTQYICYGTTNIENNLDFLISFVDSPYFTDTNVEKEKGIIAEEIKMYDDIPEYVLDFEMRKCALKSFPMRVDVAGTIKEINKITKEDLYLCYKNFYRKDNMFIIAAGNIENVETLKDIAKNHIHKTKPVNIKIKDYHEPDEINIPYKELKMNVILPKVGLILKINKKDLGIEDDALLSMYLQMFNTLVFGYSSDFREELRKEQLTVSFYTEWQTADKHKLFLIQAETDKPDTLLERIREKLKDISLNKEDFDRMKKVWVANEVKASDNVETTVNNIFYDLITYNKVLDNRIDCIKSLNFETLNKIIEKINFDNIAEIRILPKDKTK